MSATPARRHEGARTPRFAAYRWGAVERRVRIAALAAAVPAAFTAAVDLVRWIRPSLLFSADAAWLLPCLLLWLFVVAGAALAGLALWAAIVRLGRSAVATAPPGLPFSRAALAALLAAAVACGAAARLFALADEPAILYVDDLTLIAPSLDLTGSPGDFRDAIRPAPYGGPVYGSVGVLYLELYRLSLKLWGTTVLGVRFPSALGGILSLLTAALLGRAVLPRGGGTLAALVLAGLRWHLILSRWAWNMVFLAPVTDLAALLVVRARSRRGRLAAAAAGFVAGLGAHVYLSAWAAALALLLAVAWPLPDERVRSRAFALRSTLAAALFCVGFAAAAAPLFLLDENRQGPYFARAAGHNVLKEIGYRRSPMPVFAAAADSLGGPWFVPDPTPRCDIPDRTRLGVLAPFLFLAFARALLAPRENLSALLLAHAAAGFASSVAGGESLLPNGCRYGYLTTLTAVGVAAGLLAALGAVTPSRRRLASLAGIGLVAVSGALGVRDTLAVWSPSRAYFDDLFGYDTAVARTVARWARVGRVALEPRVVHHEGAAAAVARYRLDPGAARHDALFPDAPDPRRAFRVARPGTVPSPGERVVERVRDGWGRTWAVVLGRRTTG